MTRWMCTALLVLSLAACRIVSVEDYVHEPTRSERHQLTWSEPFDAPAATEDSVLLVPDFRLFAVDGERKSASLRVVSPDGVDIDIERVALRNLDTGESRMLPDVVRLSTPSPLTGTDRVQHRFRLADGRNETTRAFDGADALELTVRYSVDDGDARETVMRLERITRRDVAWPT